MDDERRRVERLVRGQGRRRSSASGAEPTSDHCAEQLQVQHVEPRREGLEDQDRRRQVQLRRARLHRQVPRQDEARDTWSGRGTFTTATTVKGKFRFTSDLDAEGRWHGKVTFKKKKCDSGTKSWTGSLQCSPGPSATPEPSAHRRSGRQVTTLRSSSRPFALDEVEPRAARASAWSRSAPGGRPLDEAQRERAAPRQRDVRAAAAAARRAGGCRRGRRAAAGRDRGRRAAAGHGRAARSRAAPCRPGRRASRCSSGAGG